MSRAWTLELKLKDQSQWEVALSRPFLSGEILFSSISPKYEESLKEELYACFNFMHIPFNELYNMPIKDRKYYISRHNEIVEHENENRKEHKMNE